MGGARARVILAVHVSGIDGATILLYTYMTVEIVQVATMLDGAKKMVLQ